MNTLLCPVCLLARSLACLSFFFFSFLDFAVCNKTNSIFTIFFLSFLALHNEFFRWLVNSFCLQRIIVHRKKRARATSSTCKFRLIHNCWRCHFFLLLFSLRSFYASLFLLYFCYMNIGSPSSQSQIHTHTRDVYNNFLFHVDCCCFCVVFTSTFPRISLVWRMNPPFIISAFDCINYRW